MTDEERTPMQANEQAQGKEVEQADADTTANADAQEQTEGQGLLSRLVDVAKTAASTVAGVTENVVGAAQHLIGKEHMHASDGTVVPVNDAGEPVVSEQAPQNQEGSSVVERVSDVAQDAVETVTSAAQVAVAQVRRVGARVYSTSASTETSGQAPAVEQPAAQTSAASEAAPQADTEAGASFEPTDGGAKGGKPRRFKDVQSGMQLEGKVTSIALYGVFIDVGVGRDGLVHISEMSETRVESPTELVQIGDPVTVWVKSVDADARRISLTMRDPNRPKPQRERRGPRKPEVDREKLASLKAGDNLEGTISSLAPFGAFVDIGVGKDGLVHISELAEGRIEKPEDAVQVGERYTFKVLEADPEGKRISLSLRRAQRTQRLQQLEPGTLMDGTISGLAPFGAFVDIGVGRDGLVHISELSPERVNSVEDAVKVGDKVQVKVIEIDPNSKRISLTMRVDEDLPNDRARPAGRVGSAYSSGPETPEPAYTPSFGGGGGAPAGGYGGGFAGGGGAPAGGFGEGRGGAGRGEGRGGGFGGGRGEGRGSAGRGEGRGEGRGGAGRGRGDRDAARGSNRLGGGVEGRGGRGGRREGQIYEPSEEVYSFEDPEEETFTGDATLEDLMSKFNSGKSDRRGTKDRRDEREDDEEEGNSGGGRRDAIRRTLAMRDEE